MTEYVEVARAESERGEVVLRRRVEDRAADALELRVNGVFVMDTKETGSEVELAAAALDLVDDPRRVVVGGLGLGFTTQRVLADHRVEDVRVVEIEGALIGWMRDGTISHGPALLAHACASSTPTSCRRSRKRCRPTTSCCSTWTTARVTSCTRATRPSTSASSSWPRGGSSIQVGRW